MRSSLFKKREDVPNSHNRALNPALSFQAWSLRDSTGPTHTSAVGPVCVRERNDVIAKCVLGIFKASDLSCLFSFL